MTEELIGLPHDHSQAILDHVKARLMEKGVAHVRQYDGIPSAHMFIGIGNHHIANLEIPHLNEKPSEETAEQLYSEWLESVESQIRNGSNE